MKERGIHVEREREGGRERGERASVREGEREVIFSEYDLNTKNATCGKIYLSCGA